MKLPEHHIEELADLLDDAPGPSDARTRLLCLAELLRTLTDRDHPLSNAQIRAIMVAKYPDAAAPAENTLNADIRALRDAGCLGLEIHTGSRGTWCENSRLSAEDVRLLLNAVQSSRLLTHEQSAQLQEGLFGLVSRFQEEDMASEVFVDQRPRKASPEVFDTCTTIARAIRLGKKLEFGYAYSDYDGEPVLLEGDSGSTLRVETPIALLFSENRYYLESYSDPAWRHGIKLMHSRVDRMRNVRISEQDACSNRDVYNAKRSVQRRMREGFEMLQGPSRTLFLRVRADKTNEMFDRFGFGLAFGQFVGELGAVDTTAITCVKVAAQGTFFRWLSGCGGGVCIVKPKDELWVTSGPWARTASGKSFEELVSDYEDAKAGYRAYLEQAAAGCE